MTMNDDIALGFLAAAIDGEGSFMLRPQSDLRVLRKGRPSLSIRAAMEIENTCEAFIDKVEEALNILGISPGYRLHRSFKSYDKTSYFKRYGFDARPETVLGGGKNYYRLAVTAREDLRRLINTVGGEFTVKQAAIGIINEHLARVGDQPFFRPTIEDLEMCQRLHELQGRRRNPFSMAKWQACLNGDYAGYRANLREVTPCQAEGTEAMYLGRRRDQSVRKS